MKDALGDRMKVYEGQETYARFLPNVPVVARIDGRCFSKLTKGLVKPFDKNFTDVMCAVAQRLVAETNANIAYVQSDEINLCWYASDPRSEIFFGGRKFKMVAQLAALATAYFHIEGARVWMGGLLTSKIPTFDARVFQVPSLAEGANVFLWRQRDARRNAVSMVARSFFSHGDLMYHSTIELLTAIKAEGADYEQDYDWRCRNGVFVRKVLVERNLTEEELSRIPKDKQPTGPVKRHEYQMRDLPLMSDIDNPTRVIFFGEEPNAIHPTPTT
jgi:tRNA(His) 5'-end guanylyltransferase